MATVNIFWQNLSSPLDLTVHDSGDASPLEDLFFFWGNISRFDNSIQLSVFLYSGGDNRNYASFRMNTESKGLPANTQGVASILDVKNAQGELLAGDDFLSDSDRNAVIESIAAKTWVTRTTETQFFAIPKKLFFRSSNFDFSDVHRMAFIWENVNAGNVCCIGDVQIVGGGKNESGAGAATSTRGGVQGTYRYRVTFLNTTTGNRSNAGPVTQIARDVNRGYVQLTGLPVSSDPQVDAREIWRTMGDGTRFFKIATIADNTTTTFDDQVADFAGLDSAQGVTVMSTEELPEDNDVPFADHDQTIIHTLTAFWINSDPAKSGRVYYSPIGRPEAQKGFIDVSSSGDPLQRLVVFQGIRYVFSEAKLYRIDGSDPYTTTEISGVPGVSFAQRRTVVSTPYGLVWQANDGVRIYNGSRSALLAFDAVGKLFRGESAENLSAFEGIVATFARGEYIISDGTQCLAVAVESGAWRDVGFNDLTSLFYEWDSDVLQGGRTSRVELLEVEGATSDAGTAIDVAWETAAAEVDPDNVIFVERAIIDGNTNGQTLTPTFVHQYDSDALSTISNASRSSFEREIQELVLRPAMRLTGSVSNRVTINDVQLEYRKVELGINIDGGGRTTIPGRWREDAGANGQIVFEVEGSFKDLDATDRLFVLDRLTVEADTQGVTVTPSVRLSRSTIALAALSTTSGRRITTYDIDRLGPLDEVILEGPFFTSGTRPRIYRVEAHFRELPLTIELSETGQKIARPGRAPSPSTGVEFEVQPINQDFNGIGKLYFIERLIIEADTNGNSITPQVFYGTGGGDTYTAFSTTSRQYHEISVERAAPLRQVTLNADFTQDIQIFGITAVIRPVELGIKFPDGSRVSVDGRITDGTNEIEFDIDPNDRRFDGFSFVPLIERMFVDIDSASANISPTIVMENQTVAFTDAGTSSRDTIQYEVNRVGRLRSVKIGGDWESNVARLKLYGVEIQMRPLPLEINIITNT